MKPQYESAIFPQTPEQEELAAASVEARREGSARPVYTKVRPASAEPEAARRFWDAEWYHQKYNKKNAWRTAALAAFAALSLLPPGTLPGQLAVRQGLFYLAVASLVPQLMGSVFDRVLRALE
mmetsp:Transcript_24556/g.83974  ORF Transcript_24556/g.83974 Transcript_24556/m.83974 type:complete len:123 (-) Transcript_24556:183-551(-)